MKWLMLCREPRLYSCERLKQACEQYGIQLDILDPNKMLLKLVNVEGKPTAQLFYQAGNSYDNPRSAPYLLTDYQAILPRFGTASTEMGCNVLQHFEMQGIATLNSSIAFRLARDKWQSLQRLASYGLPIPPTSYAGELFATVAQLKQHEFPLITKTLSGSQGVGVMLGEELYSTQSLIDTLKQANVKTLVQDFIRESKGQDIRAFVIGDQVIASMQRIGSQGEFRANLHQGGTTKKIELSNEEKLLAVQATKALGLDVAGVDLIRGKQDTFILEVNASPGLEGIEKISEVDIASLMVKYLLM